MKYRTSMNKRPGAYSKGSAKKGRCLFEGGSLIELSFPFNKQYLRFDYILDRKKKLIITLFWGKTRLLKRQQGIGQVV